MKFDRIARAALAAGTSLALGLGATACSRDYTVAYLYSTSAANGTVSAFEVDYQNGVLTQVAGSPFPTNFTQPSTVIAAPSGKFLYVLGGMQNAAVEEYAIGTDGKLYGQHTYTLTGTYPTAAAIDNAGKFLYVTYQYATGSTPLSGGFGGVSIFPINSDNSLGTPSNVSVGRNPVGIAVSSKGFVYVVDQEGATLSTVQPNVIQFAQNAATGALTAIGGTNTFGIRAGVTPSGIAVDPTGRFVYVTDKTSNQIVGFQAAYTTTGVLTPLVSSPYTTGSFPVSLTIDPRGKYLYTANYNSSSVSSFSINAADGSLGGAAGVSNFTTATGPTCVSVEPALGIYLYTSNYLDGSISGGQISPNTGAVAAVQNTPFPVGALPSCVAAVPNGEHSSSLVNP